MTEHIGKTEQIKNGPWTVGYYGVCQCAWIGPDRERISQAAADLSVHFRDVQRDFMDAFQAGTASLTDDNLRSFVENGEP